MQSTADVIENLGNLASQVASVHDSVDEAMVEQEFAGLKAFWQFHADCLLDDLGACKADQGLGFGQIDIAQAGEAGGHSAHGRVGEDGNIKPTSGIVACQGRRDLGHLH